MRDIFNNIGVRASVAPAVQAAAINGTSIDTLGFSRLVFVVSTGAIVGAGDFGVKLQESDDNATFTDVAAAQIQTTAPATLLTGTVSKIGYIGWKRYVRPAVTKAGGTSIALGVDAILSGAASKPVA